MRQLDYQLRAIKNLKEKSVELLDIDGNRTIVFKAPTGSGKTVMMGEYLKELSTLLKDKKDLSFIWAAPRKLHHQSKKSLENHFINSFDLKCSNFEDLSDRMIGPNEILFLNWESINRERNIYYRENEQEFYLEKIIENTISDGRILVLIIDESHHTAGAEKTQELISLINAKLTIEVSATPPNILFDASIVVHRQHVIDEEMIKKQIMINPNFNNKHKKTLGGNIVIESTAKESTNEFVLRKALEKREELSKKISDEGSKVNPLLLIQLPDKKKGQEDLVEDIKKILKNNHDITIDNNLLAIYLADDKENLATISKNDSQIEVMIFKQAIALGWDCPRASILVLFRDSKSIVFSIQTIGRIMRMPELKFYKNEDLNLAYIYTNLSDISINQDIADGYVSVLNAKRNDDIYENIELLSCHSMRQREKTRLSPKFIEYFLNEAKAYDLKNKIKIDIKNIKKDIITDILISELDEEFDHLDLKDEDRVSRLQTEEEIQRLFDEFSINLLAPLFPEERSIKRINKSIYEFFKIEFPKLDYAGTQAQLVVLSSKNDQYFKDVINISKEKYLEDVKKQSKKIIYDTNWEIPKSVNYSDDYKIKDYSRSIMQPFYEKSNTSEVERNFASYLNSKNDEIDWWFKNGERDATFFAISRNQAEEKVPFYVDWIVKYKDGRIGLFETKAGITAENASSRANGLFDYISIQNNEGKNFFGGIVIEKNNTFWIHLEKDYNYNEDNLIDDGWIILS